MPKSKTTTTTPEGVSTQVAECDHLPPTLSEAMTDAITSPARIEYVSDDTSERIAALALLPPGWTRLKLDDLFPKAPPLFREGNVQFHDLASFGAYVSRHATGSSVIFAAAGDNGGGTITAVLDDGAATLPGRRVDRVTVQMRPDPRFAAWVAVLGKAIPQRQFIDFIREHDREFVAPSGAQMRSNVNSLELKKSVSFKHVEREAGAAGVDLVYTTDTTQANGSVPFPDEFTIRVPLLRFCPPVEITGRILFDVNDGVMSFVLRLDDLHILLESAWQAAITEVMGLVPAVPVLNGTP